MVEIEKVKWYWGSHGNRLVTRALEQIPPATCISQILVDSCADESMDVVY